MAQLPAGSWHRLPHWSHGFCMRCIVSCGSTSFPWLVFIWNSAVRVQDSQAYRKMDVTRECISCILELREILLSIQTGFSLVHAAVVCAILESISGLEPSSVITEPRYIKHVPVPYGSMLHTPPTNYHPLAAEQELYQKASFKRCSNVPLFQAYKATLCIKCTLSLLEKKSTSATY